MDCIEDKIDEAYKAWTELWDLGYMTPREIHNAGYRHGVEDYEKQEQSDGARLRWLTDDHADAETRARCREILERMPVMSYSATAAAIDEAMKAQNVEVRGAASAASQRPKGAP